jgi:hypothetical protein
MRLNLGNACCHSVQNLSSSRLLSKIVKIGTHKIIILPVVLYGCEIWSVVLYGCEIWSLKLRKEHILRAFENRVLTRIFGPKRDEVTGGWRKMHNEELHNLYPSPNKISIIKSRRMRWAGHEKCI